jgi:hypothetical protein
MNKFFVWYETGEYDAREMEVFDSEVDVIDFLNARASNEELRFTVIEGREVKFKPVSVATKYVRDRG